MANTVIYNPVADLNRLHNEVTRLFENFFPVRRPGSDSAVWSPAVDVYEKDDMYVVSLDLPGLTKNDVEISFDNGLLQISGERTEAQEEQETRYHRIERWYGRFFRSIPFDRDVDPNKIKAKMDNGVLTIQLRKTEDSKPVKVKIS